SKRILEEMIDEEAAAHVDAIAYCLFTAFWSDLPSSKITDLFPWRPAGMDEAGIDMLKVLIDRCHRHNMQFIADIRMNDRHGVPPNGIAKNHSEWSLFGGAYDYALEPVRQAMLDFNQEVLAGYEVDGIEYDYMRWCHMFKRGDGVSPYNYQFSFERRGYAHRSSAYAAYMWPAALGWLRELRDPEEINSHDRHYLFYSLWKNPHKSPTSFSYDDNIYLDRAKPVLEGSWRFRMAEDFSNLKLRTTMQFKVLGLAEEEKLDIQINGKQVPVDYITPVFDKNGQSLYEGDPLDPFHLYVIDMNWETTGREQPLIFGDNQLTVHLVPLAARAEGTVSVEELECYVYVRK
ncbi:MAG: hypothetical protein ACC628_22320, partial [Pirellulaceae bacterium]